MENSDYKILLVDDEPDILEFFEDFETLPFYIFDIFYAHDYSTLDEFVGTPTVFVFSGGVIIETYVGSIQVREFIALYGELDLTYDTFDNQHLNSYQEILDIENETYLVYYYIENCPNCIAIKDRVLSWAFTKNIDNMFFMNGSTITDPDNVPTELQILKTGTPLLIVMSNGIFTEEYYLGQDDILEYLEIN